MPLKDYSHYHTNTLQVKVIQSQHCIEVEGLQIELIYLFGQNCLHVYIEDRLVLSTQMQMNKTQVNYTNLIEVAVQYWKNEKTKVDAKEKAELKELYADNRINPDKEFVQYVIESFTTVIE